MTDPHRELIEQVRRANKVLSLYALSLQESAALSGSDHNGIVRALRDLVASVEIHASRTEPRTLVQPMDSAPSIVILDSAPGTDPRSARTHPSGSSITNRGQGVTRD